MTPARRSVPRARGGGAEGRKVIDLDPIFKKARDLEPLSPSVQRLASIVSAGDTAVEDLVEVVTYDQALTARVLRLANSAASASASPIKTVKQAVIRMGSGTVLAMAVANEVRGRLKQALPEYGFAEEGLWRHSVAAAIAAEDIARVAAVRVPPETFTAALLHDIGKLVLARFLPPQVLSLMAQLQAEQHLTRLQSEIELLHTHHAEIGGLIAQHWKLPEAVTRGITYHHMPERCADPVCDAVCLANHMAKVIKAAPAPEDPAPPAAAARERLKIAEADYQTASLLTGARFAELLGRYEA
jgi:putative nucleotidyltransferase with HDIG domain